MWPAGRRRNLDACATRHDARACEGQVVVGWGGRSRAEVDMASTRVTDFAAFYEATFGRTVACAYAVTGDLREAEDAAQEAYVQAWRRWRGISGYDDPAAWVRHVAVNQAISRVRRRRTARRYLHLAGPPAAADPPDVTTVELVRAL